MSLPGFAAGVTGAGKADGDARGPGAGPGSGSGNAPDRLTAGNIAPPKMICQF